MEQMNGQVINRWLYMVIYFICWCSLQEGARVAQWVRSLDL